jgi:hypothetical protein
MRKMKSHRKSFETERKWVPRLWHTSGNLEYDIMNPNTWIKTVSQI